MADTKRTEGVDMEKYDFFTPEDPEAQKKEEEKAWNHRKLKKVIVNDYILSYQELLEMRYVFQSQLEQFEDDLDIKLQQAEKLREKIKEYQGKVEEWTKEIEQAEKDIPEIGEKAAAERKADAEKKAKHEANLRGEGKGRALEMNPQTGDIEDKTGTKG